VTGFIVGAVAAILLMLILQWVIRDATRTVMEDTVVPELEKIATLIEELNGKIKDPDEED
jgi:hypothetical protein